MRFALQVCTNVAGVPLEVLILSALLRGSYKRYPAPFAYVLVVLVTTILETALYVAGRIYFARDRHIWMQYHSCYWVDEFIRMVLEFPLVISFVYRATATVRPRRILRLAVSCGAVLFAAVTFAVYFKARVAPGQWMTPWASNLHFCAAILDLALWAMLVGSGTRDEILLMLSGALGIQFAGGAIGEAVRNLAQANQSTVLEFVGDTVLMASTLVFLYIWRQALRGQPQNTDREAFAHPL